MFIFLPESHIVHLIPHVCRLKDQNQDNTWLIVTKQTKEEETKVESWGGGGGGGAPPPPPPPTIQTSVKFRDFVEEYLGCLWTGALFPAASIDIRLLV